MLPEGSFHFKCLLKSCIDENSLSQVSLAVALHGSEWIERTDLVPKLQLKLLWVGDITPQTSDCVTKVKRSKQHFWYSSFICKTRSWISPISKTLGVCFWQFAKLLNGMHEFQKRSASNTLSSDLLSSVGNTTPRDFWTHGSGIPRAWDPSPCIIYLRRQLNDLVFKSGVLVIFDSGSGTLLYSEAVKNSF